MGHRHNILLKILFKNYSRFLRIFFRYLISISSNIYLTNDGFITSVKNFSKKKHLKIKIK